MHFSAIKQNTIRVHRQTSPLAVLLAIGSLASSGHGHAQTFPQPSVSPTSSPTRYQPNRFPRRALAYYQIAWGVDSLSVRAVESGELIRFSWRVLDPEKSKILNDKKLEPKLEFPEGRVSLVIPSLEKVGQLRQSSAPEAGKSYWMAFSNPGRHVKSGDRVNIVIGQFHAEGLVVD